MKSIEKYILFFTCLLTITLASCKKESYPPVFTKARFNMVVRVGVPVLEWNTMQYLNSAGNKYSVSKINMYISNITLKKSDGKTYVSNKVFYIDPAVSSKSFFMLDSIPPGAYSEISFLVGLNSANNKSFALPTTTDNINMAWPDMMGGGYHFMKFEGNFLDTADAEQGFAFHLGKNIHLPSVAFTCSMNQKYWNHQYDLNFDLNEIFDNPYTYDLNVEMTHTMADSTAMSRIKNNITDAFSLVQVQ